MDNSNEVIVTAMNAVWVAINFNSGKDYIATKFKYEWKSWMHHDTESAHNRVNNNNRCKHNLFCVIPKVGFYLLPLIYS